MCAREWSKDPAARRCCLCRCRLCSRTDESRRAQGSRNVRIDGRMALLYTEKYFLMNHTLIKRPSGFIPVAMSLAALAIVIAHAAMFGVAREADEGTAAHLWQILMAGQLPVVLFFAVKWLPIAPGRALPVLALQVAAALAAMFPVWWFQW